jgi:hypothetical protein
MSYRSFTPIAEYSLIGGVRSFPFYVLHDHLQVCGVPSAQQHGRARLVDQHELASVVTTFATA